MGRVEASQHVWEWTPLELVRKATELASAEFTLHCGAPYLLLVADPTGEIARALTPRENVVFETEMCDPESLTPVLLPALPRAASELESELAAALPLAERLLQQRCHVIPIRARRPGVSTTSITVGRTAEQDVVITHRSVSKTHAWFELSPNGQIFVRDANSTNSTFINGQRIRRPVEVHPGCLLRFGSVEAHLYRPQSLWDVFHAG
jgi:hypothetical protein